MEKKKRYEFDPAQIYRLVAVTDREGKDKVPTRLFYEERVGCIATKFEYDEEVHHDGYRLNMKFIQSEHGMPMNKSLHTSPLHEVEETERGLKLYTRYSIYEFEYAEIKEVPYQDEANLIELFLSPEETYYFCKGRYYDKEKTPYELKEDVHLGMFQDSVLIRFFPEAKIYDYACRFFPMGSYVEFYNTIYKQQGYSTQMLIHNAGKTNLEIRFSGKPYTWTIAPGENKRIMPYSPDGADKEE